MEPNKITSILQRRANRITHALIYALLEWTLISLLLLNSLFSVLILKFARYFGLKPPCLFCSRIDHHFLGSHKKKSNIDTNKFSLTSYTEIICEQHAAEISKIGYCSHHRKLVESQSFCHGCSPSSASLSSEAEQQQDGALFRWLREIGIVRASSDGGDHVGNGEMNKCACCDEVIVQRKAASLGGLDQGNVVTDRDTGDLVINHFSDDHKFAYEPLDDDDDDEDDGGEDGEERENDEGEGLEAEKEPLLNDGGDDDDDVVSKEIVTDQNLCPDMLPQHLEFYVGHDDYRLIPVEFVDDSVKKEEGREIQDHEDDSKGVELVFEGNELVECEVGKSKNLSTIEEEREEENPVEGLGERSLLGLEGQNEGARGIGRGREHKQEYEEEEEEEGSAVEDELIAGQKLEERDIEDARVVVRDQEQEGDQEHDLEVEGSAVEDERIAGEKLEKENKEARVVVRDQEQEQEQEHDQEVEGSAVEDELTAGEKLEEREIEDARVLVRDQEQEREQEHDQEAEESVVEEELMAGEKLEEREIDQEQEREQEHDQEAEESTVEEKLMVGEKLEEKEIEEARVAVRDQEQEREQEHDQEAEESAVGDEGIAWEPSEEKTIEESLEISSLSQEEKVETENVSISQGQEERFSTDSEHSKRGERQEDEALEPTEMPSSTSESPIEDVAFDSRNDEFDAERDQDGTDDTLVQVEEPSTPFVDTEENVASDENVSTHLPSAPENDARQAEITEGERLKIDMSLPRDEAEGERIPDMKLLLLGRRESVTEESLDGSMASEAEGGEGNATVENLKSDLQAERKALRALYKELEEERSAAAIAASHTMAMITRLQEEKATVQMEALQYQRMMEEQSEYDQEALQMMNELMVKREKEKQELERELEVYRKRVVEYEERERMRVLSRRRESVSFRSRNSSASCSYAGEESDGVSIDSNHEAKDDQEQESNHAHEENGHHQDTPSDAVLGLQDSLFGFEEERQAILEQLKALEEKLFTLAEEEEEHIENMKPFEQFFEENGKDFEANGDENGFPHANGRTNGSMPKRLLPLFDAAELLDSPDGETDVGEDEFHSLVTKKPPPITNFELEKKRLAIEEEVDQVYERLQALEADREFLKHCVGSLRKGDKGLDLLQEILQHLRDLKSVELQAMKSVDQCASV